MKKWVISLIIVGLTATGLLAGMILYPSLLYANKTLLGSYTVYHNLPLSKDFTLRLTEANELLQSSELYDQQIKLDICVNDGSYYSTFMQNLRGQDSHGAFTTKLW